jgi:hypothetical protein
LAAIKRLKERNFIYGLFYGCSRSFLASFDGCSSRASLFVVQLSFNKFYYRKKSICSDFSLAVLEAIHPFPAVCLAFSLLLHPKQGDEKFIRLARFVESCFGKEGRKHKKRFAPEVWEEDAAINKTYFFPNSLLRSLFKNFCAFCVS